MSASASHHLSTDESTAPKWKYDVFLSFRGEDTRRGIVSHLYDELQKTGGIKTFMDDQGIEVGAAISPSLLRAIEESRFGIVVLSTNYASSTWCLDELTHIICCMEGKDRILPLFYDIEPTHVRNQTGSFGEAFAKHEKQSTHSRKKIKQWRVALRKVANLSGWNTRNFRSDRELVKHIVEFVRSKVLQSSANFEAQSHVNVEWQISSLSSTIAMNPSSSYHLYDNLKRYWKTYFQGRVCLCYQANQSHEELERKSISVGPYGSQRGGRWFDDGASYSAVKQLVICSDKHQIFYIQVEYDLDGMSFWSDKHGSPSAGKGKKEETVTLNYPDEFLTSIHGRYEDSWCLPTQIMSLTFHSNKKIYGPFGDERGTSFSIEVPESKIVGLFGRSEKHFNLRAIGAYLKPISKHSVPKKPVRLKLTWCKMNLFCG